MQEHRKY